MFMVILVDFVLGCLAGWGHAGRGVQGEGQVRGRGIEERKVEAARRSGLLYWRVTSVGWWPCGVRDDRKFAKRRLKCSKPSPVSTAEASGLEEARIRGG